MPSTGCVFHWGFVEAVPQEKHRSHSNSWATSFATSFLRTSWATSFATSFLSSSWATFFLSSSWATFFAACGSRQQAAGGRQQQAAGGSRRQACGSRRQQAAGGLSQSLGCKDHPSHATSFQQLVAECNSYRFCFVRTARCMRHPSKTLQQSATVTDFEL